MPELSTIQAEKPKQYGLLRFIGNKELDARKQAEIDTQKAAEEQNKEPLTALAAHVDTAWQAALRAKQNNKIEQRLLQCLRQRRSEYDPDQLAKIKTHGQGSEIYMGITNVKCRAAESWIRDVIIPPGEKPWGLDPTPEPELPPEEMAKISQQVLNEVVLQMQTLLAAGEKAESVDIAVIEERILQLKEEFLQETQEQAKDATSQFETRIEDELVETGFYEELSKFITDLVTFPTAFLKGPIVKRKKTLQWTKDKNGNVVPGIDLKYLRTYERVSPFNIYPSPGAKSLQDGYLCERLQFRPLQLQEMIGVPGYDEKAIRAVLHEFPNGLRMFLSVDQERADAEGRPQEFDDPSGNIEGIMYWGSIQGEKLREWGMSATQIPDLSLSYNACVIKIDRWVIMARLNPHPLGHRPYYGTSFEKVNDSIWGQCPPDLMRDVQRLCNAVARALVNNLAIASGPQVEANWDRIQAGEDIENLWPWKIWKTESDPVHGKPAVNFWQPDSNAEILIKVYEYYWKQGSEQTGIPNYIYGSENVGGAGKTASGLSMLMNAASKTLKGVVSHIDRDILKPIIYEHWLHLMLYDNELTKIGDINIIARASEYLIIEEQLQLRRTEFLDKTNNAIDLEIMGIPGRASILREISKSLKMKDVVPSEQEIMQRLSAPPPEEETPPPENPEGSQPNTKSPVPVLPNGGRYGGEEVRLNA